MTQPDLDLEPPKRKVTMRSVALGPENTLMEMIAEDYIREDFLDAYVADARGRWQSVEVGGIDDGPGGEESPTHVPARLNHPDAGKTFESKAEKRRKQNQKGNV